LSLPSSVVAELKRTFSDVDQAAARKLLPSEADLPLDPPYERVLLAVVGLADGSLSDLAHYSEEARADWRDVLYWHENPREADAPRSASELLDQLKRLGMPPDQLRRLGPPPDPEHADE
jgi:hypothetical protein